MEIKPKEFDIEFIERTQKLIENYEGDTEFTLLLNCLLGLIILPSEFNQKKKLKYLEVDLSKITEIKNCLHESQNFKFNPTHWDKKKQTICKIKKGFRLFIKKN